MKVSQWAEIRRLHQVEGLSQRAIARQLDCDRATVKTALELQQPPNEARRAKRPSALAPYHDKIAALLDQYPGLSAVRIWEEICRGPDGYTGSVITVRRYVKQIRPPRGRVYQEVSWQPGQAMQVDWGCCGKLRIEDTWRNVSVFVAVSSCARNDGQFPRPPKRIASAPEVLNADDRPTNSSFVWGNTSPRCC